MAQRAPVQINVPIDGATGTTTILAADPAYYFEIRGYKLTGDGAGAVKLRIDGVVVTGDYMVAGGGAVLPPSQWGMVGAANKAVSLAAGSVNVYGNVLIWKWPV